MIAVVGRWANRLVRGLGAHKGGACGAANGTCVIGKQPKRKQKTTILARRIASRNRGAGMSRGIGEAVHGGRCTLFQHARLGASGHEVHAATYGRVRRRNSTLAHVEQAW